MGEQQKRIGFLRAEASVLSTTDFWPLFTILEFIFYFGWLKVPNAGDDWLGLAFIVSVKTDPSRAATHR